ncbi:MAG TPA: Sec-independent protein translocase protein TatB [Roseiarcus sp.]|nr:Sec-independent protein translocase protein TatB [Roseiarcus sp.]
MFDFDIGKLMVVAIVALAVIPPKDLPRVMRTVGQVVGKMRRMAAEFQGQFMDAMREADLEGVRKELEALNEKAKVEADLDSVRKELEAINEKAKREAAFDPAAAIRDEVRRADEERPAIGSSEVALDAPRPEAAAEPQALPLEPQPPAAEPSPANQSAAE